jgi:hypothetical protein
MPERGFTNWDSTLKRAIPSRLVGSIVRYRGLIARSVFYLLEHNANIQSYTEQPCTIRYRVSESELPSMPDFLVTWQGRKPSLLACKTGTYLNDLQHAPQWTTGQLWCEHHDCDFMLICDIALRKGSTLFSDLLLSALHTHPLLPPTVREYLFKTFASMKSTFSVAEVVEQKFLLNSYFTKSSLRNLLYNGECSTDLMKPLHFKQSHLSWKGATREHASSCELCVL